MTETEIYISELANKINAHLIARVQKGELSNNDIISTINLLGSFLNLKTYSDYAKSEGISYNGVLHRIESGSVDVLELFNVKFVADNQ